MDKKLLKNLDISLLLNVVLLVVIGFISIYAATQSFGTEKSFSFVLTQAVAFVLGIIAIGVIISIDYHQFGLYWKIIYAICILMLIAVLIPGVGKVNKGARGWIDLGIVEMQPAELAKIGIIITFAKLLDSRQGNLNTLKDLTVPLLHIGIPIILIMLQPDLGNALVFMVIAGGMLFVAGINMKFIWGSIVALVVSFPILWNFVLLNHQKNRLITFINPYNDPLGEGYHVIQSMLAVGSGQITGKGLFQEDTMTNLNYLPEQWTDFIFSVIAELTGFIGAAFVVILFAFFLHRLLYLSRIAKDDFGSLIIIGIFFMYLFQVVENIGMTIGLMPITGITLPFISYGGSSLLTNMIAVGLVLNITMRRHKIKF
ncbi:rod shape-determining protein RodA [Garciella nitratireducens]|uniref:rod shape-determining protein RodA n=1 Tax=Garciella nitratireducens TaxID=218205 RepID=UPI000E07E4CC|nr:rod shape-determining protein RodA [Garciella nitratireducens]RBP46707.1 rod shape determining protein RodA [Garciella nitratireducens]